MAVTVPVTIPRATEVAMEGRRAERDAVAALLDALPDGGAALVLEGDAGIGKTTIWLAGVADARDRGWSVLSCRPAETEAGLPYVALGDLLDPVVDQMLPSLNPVQGAALAAALCRADATGDVNRLAVSRAALGCLREFTRRAPVLVAVDDAQWLDPSSAAVLEFVARRLGPVPAGFLLTQRRREPNSRPDLTRAFDRARLVSLQVGPLGPGDLDRLLRAALDVRLPRPRLLELARITGGNPLYALEVGRAIANSREWSPTDAIPVPEGLGSLLRLRLASLAANAEDAVLLVAAASHPTTELMEHVAGHADGLEHALRHGILERDGPRLRFSHPLLASVALESALPGRRRDIHRRLAAAVRDPGERARHLALATDAVSEATASELDDAARAVAERGAPELAALLVEHAVRLTPPERAQDRHRRLVRAADHHIASGDPARARTILEQVVAELATGPARADVLWRLADAIGDDVGASIRLCEQALVEADGDAAIEARIHTALGVFTWIAGDLERAAGHCRSSALCAEQAGDVRQVAISLGELCHAQTVLGRGHRDLDMEHALQLERDLVGLPTAMRPSFQLGVMRMYTDDPDGARPLLQAGLAQAVAAGDEASRFTALFRLAELELRAGNWATAVGHADEAVVSASQAGIEQEQSVVLMAQALIRAHLGELELAEGAASRALVIADSGGDRIVSTRVRGVLGFIELSRGCPGAALVHLDPAAAELRALRVGELSISGVVQNRIEALVTVGRLEEAEAEIDRVEELGRPTSRAWHAAIAARGRSLVAAARGDVAGARAEIARALEAHTRLPQPFELGRSLLAQGQIERRFKQRTPARRALVGALDLFDGLGAPRWAERTVEELARIPGRPPGRGDLSETERLVAELAARGHSNKEIAGSLFISVRTVEANLSRAYAKFEVRSRTELAIRLGHLSPP